MSFKHTYNPAVTTPAGQVVGTAQEVTADQELNYDIPVPGPSTDMLVATVIDVSQLKSILLLSDRDLTIETNSASVPDDTIALKAGVPYIWNTNSYDACLLTADVTALYVTLVGVVAATLKIRGLIDPTV